MRRFRYNLLFEGARDKALNVFMPYFEKRGIDMNISKLKQLLLSKFVNEASMNNLSLDSNYYLIGVARYYFNGDLTVNKRLNILYPNIKDRFNDEVCKRLNALILILRNSYIDSVGTKWEQPEDFGTLTLPKLLKKYGKKINDELGISTTSDNKEEKNIVSNDYSAGKNYTYDILYSYEDARKYNAATRPGAWCITYGEQHYNAYVRRLKIHYVIFRQDGYEKIPRKVGKNFTKRKPHDEYGNSLIAVLQSNSSPEPIYITSRWNHGDYSDNTQGTEADHAYTKEEFLNVIGCDESVLQRAFEQWKANVKKESPSASRSKDRMEKLSALRILKYEQMRINGGAQPVSTENISYHQINDPTSNGGANPKGLFIVTVDLEDSQYFTLMDRKEMKMNDLLVNTSNIYYPRYAIKIIEKTYILFYTGRAYMLYDRIRRQFMNLDGVKSFKKTDLLSNYYGYNHKYVVLAVSGRQLALINTETMKPVKSRGGSPWFEVITCYRNGRSSNIDYSGKISLPYFKDTTEFLNMVYDSSSGERYIFDMKTGKFVDLTSNIPEGFTVDYECRCPLPGNNYIGLIQTEGFGEYGDFNYSGKKIAFMFMSLDNGELYNINGHSIFVSFKREENVVGYMPEGSEYAFYYDTETNELLKINGTTVTTRGGVFIMSELYSEYVEISLSKVVGEITDFHKKALFYNKKAHMFFHMKHGNEDIYEFSYYGSEYIYKPGVTVMRGFKTDLLNRGIIMKLPTSEELMSNENHDTRNEAIASFKTITENINKYFNKIYI